VACTAMDAAPAVMTVVVDMTGPRRPINPMIYGLSGATPAQLAALNPSWHRHGGNATSRYNWQQNATNRASDWYFESLSEPGTAPGAAVDQFITEARAAGVAPVITLPMLDWVAGLGPNRRPQASFSIAKYGPQRGRDAQWFPDAGDGVDLHGRPITGNDPRDAHVPSTPALQASWMRHLTQRWGTAARGGVPAVVLDNEPSLWWATHRDVAPTGATMRDVSVRTLALSTAVKAVDPTVAVMAPEEWGWPGYFHSGADQQWSATHGWWRTAPDRAAARGADYLPWLLAQWRASALATGRWPVDIVTVHYYPSGGEYSTAVTPAMVARRARSTRSLWDAGYVDESWIAAPVALIPRLRAWVDQHYRPGTPIGITEYHWGADAHMSGAVAQADVLGIFGREGLDYAARWGTPALGSPAAEAFRLFRNYDGRGSRFGETSLRVTGDAPDSLAAFAAVRADGTATVALVHKATAGGAPVTVQVPGVRPGQVERWELAAGQPIRRLPDVVMAHGGLAMTVPPQSVTLLVVPARPVQAVR